MREALSGEFEIHESETRGEAIELIRDIGSVDVAIVDLRREPADEERARSTATRRSERCARRPPGMGIVAHGERPERHLASVALQAGASAYVARTAERRGDGQGGLGGARAGALRRPGGAAAAAAAAS